MYVCENVYDESRRVVRPLPQTGLKGYDYQSTSVVADEVFYFKNPIHPQKVGGVTFELFPKFKFLVSLRYLMTVGLNPGLFSVVWPEEPWSSG